MEHACDLAERIGSLLLDDSSADITLIVEGEYILAHKLILSTASDFFRDLRGSQETEIVLDDTPLRGFKQVMSYIYTGQLKLGELDEETILEILEIAHLFEFGSLQGMLCQYLKGILSTLNVCTILDKAHLLQLEDLSEACYRFMDGVPEAVLQSDSFHDLPASALHQALSRDSFCADEIEIFKAVEQWCAYHPHEEDQSLVLETIRLPLIAAVDLVTTVNDSCLISTDCVIEAIQMRESHSADLNFRGAVVRDENLATPDRGARKLAASAVEDIVTPQTCPVYRSESMPPHSAEITFDAESGLTVALSKAFFINHVAFRLSDAAPVSYSYHIDVSVNLVDWFQVVDHSNFLCRSYQKLYFEPRVVRYIRIAGTRSDESTHIELSMCEVSYVENNFEFSHGHLVPDENVASEARGAVVIECEGGWNEMIGGSSSDDLAQTGWTWHLIGSGSITIQLPQPYTVNSMRFFLAEEEGRSYSYYVETSLDQRVWTCIADRTSDLHSSWQVINFDALPVSFIKITGTASTADEYLLCSYFECPAQEPSFDETSAAEEGFSHDA